MKEVKIKKEKLREIVQKNRDGHRALWEEAYDGYQRAVISALEENLALFKAKKAKRVSINEAPPEEHIDDYDEMLRKLELSEDEVVVLDSEDFSRYVMDDWSWKRNWSVSNAKYLSSK
jgi:hypothetical protein